MIDLKIGNLQAIYSSLSGQWSDIVGHMPLLKASAKGNVMEIGVRQGISTISLLSGLEEHGGHLWSFDINPCGHFEHPQWTFTQADSIADAERIKAIIPEELDVLFVDGDHSEEGCRSDLENYGPRADMIFVHDCECPEEFPGVRKAFEEFAAQYGKAHSVVSGSFGMGVIDMCRINKARKIDGWMNDEEMRWLAREANKRECIVEVGCYQGRSTRAMADNTMGTVYAFDDWGGLRENWWIQDTPANVKTSLFDRFNANLADHIRNGSVVIVRANHEQDIPFEHTPEMVFIDGGHEHHEVKRDIERWLPRIAKGGIICGHDFHIGGVMQAVTELLPKARTAAGYIWAMEIE